MRGVGPCGRPLLRNVFIWEKNLPVRGFGGAPRKFFFSFFAAEGLCWRMKEKVQGSLTQEERAASCKLSIGLPGPYIVVAIPCGRHAWAAHYPRFHLQCHSPAKSEGGEL